MDDSDPSFDDLLSEADAHLLAATKVLTRAWGMERCLAERWLDRARLGTCLSALRGARASLSEARGVVPPLPEPRYRCPSCSGTKVDTRRYAFVPPKPGDDKLSCRDCKHTWSLPQWYKPVFPPS